MSNPVGRPSKQPGGLTLNKTRTFQRCFSEDDIQEMADILKDRLRDPSTTTGDVVKLFTSLSRYIMLSADVEAQVKAEVEKQLTPERMKELQEFVKRGGVVEES